MAHKGSCLCGAITFQIKEDVATTGACHCDMCRKWSGGVYLAVKVGQDRLEVQETGALATYTSSPWAERCFCSACGSSLWYRVTADGPHKGEYHIGLGSLDAPEGIVLTEEIFIDKKPRGYSFAQDTQKMTAAEVMAMFGGG